jgi:Lsr2
METAMSRQQIIRLVDDLDGGLAEQTVTFGLDGKHYEIDLSGANAEALRAKLGPFLHAARLAPGSILPKMERSSPGRAAIRRWARANGWPKLADVGSITDEIVTAYYHRGEQPAAPKPRKARAR